SQAQSVTVAGETARLAQPRRATEAPPVLRSSKPAQNGASTTSTAPSGRGGGGARALGQDRDAGGLQQLATFGRFTGRDPQSLNDQDYANRRVRLSFAC
ncbi:MAG TPA: hypothetical protein VND93_32755, partial [Myxococcales bacterium]|nr:hypothetical protein [Myxococcales bacterium]